METKIKTKYGVGDFVYVLGTDNSYKTKIFRRTIKMVEVCTKITKSGAQSNVYYYTLLKYGGCHRPEEVFSTAEELARSLVSK